jgi:glucose-6-phosphate isomerase
VELGKVLAKDIYTALKSEESSSKYDSSTNALISKYLELQAE